MRGPCFFMQNNYLIPTYTRQPVAFSHGDGAWLVDEHGKRYLDGLAGIAVNLLGYNHPALQSAISEQAKTLLHTSNLYRIPLQEKLAERLCQLAAMQAAFFCNSGTEANEAAIKLARLHGHKHGIDNPTIIVMEGGFHGRTLAALAATAAPRARAGFDPLPQGFVRVPYGDAGAVAALADDANIAAVLLEPIQGEGGVRLPADGYLRSLRQICDDNNWLLMLDEVQTGIGRTGKWFAHQHEQIQPDVMTLAKALGGGMPIGAVLVAGAAHGLFEPGNHGSTFGGNPLACRAALTVLDALENDGLVAHAASMGAGIRADLDASIGQLDAVRDIRGRGLMIGIELDRPCAELVDRAREQGLLINVTAGCVIRLLPPLVLQQEDADKLTHELSDLIRTFVETSA